MSEPTCINLEERFGRRYRIAWEAGGKTKPLWPREEWPWLMELRCHGGKAYPWGGELLQAYTDRRRTGAQLRALPCVLDAKGDDEVVVRFHVDHIEQVLAILKPYRRRQVSEAERERLRALGFQRQGDKSHCESDLAALESTIGTPRPTGTGGSHAL
jgi:hypothetical protein